MFLYLDLKIKYNLPPGGGGTVCVSQKARDIIVPGTGSERERDILVGEVGARELGLIRRNPILSLNTINNDLFPPQNNPIGFFSITFKKCLFIDRN